MNKMYLVKEVHSYNKFNIIGVCPNRELAEKLRQKNSESWDLDDCAITFEKWEGILGNVFMSEKFPEKSIADIAVELYSSEYSEPDIRRADREYTNMSYVSTIIEEIKLYATESDIILYGIND